MTLYACCPDCSNYFILGKIEERKYKRYNGDIYGFTCPTCYYNYCYLVSKKEYRKRKEYIKNDLF